MQNDQQTFLSLSIPTYNRSKQIARLLHGVVPQLTPEIEVVIRDDSPNKETEKVVKKIFEEAHKTSNLSYYKGEKLGMDRAALFVVQKARGKYVWTFGDDDELSPGALARVVALIRQHPDTSFIWANYICPTVPGSSEGLGEDRFFKDGNEALEVLTNKMTLLSTFIFEKEKAMRAWPIAQKYIGSWWSIMAFVLEAMAGEGKVYFLKGPYVINHLEEHGASDFEPGVQVFGINLFLIFWEFRNRFRAGAIRKFFSKHFGDVWRGILVNRARYPVGVVHCGLFWKLAKLYWTYPEFWLALPFFLMPRFILSPFYRTYKFFFNKRRWRF